jgi:DNA-binding NtrC family response regulator
MSMRILLVDDDNGSLKGMKFAIEMMGYDCDDYLSAAEAVEGYSPEVHDLAVIDYQMPGLNGFEVLSRMRLKNPELEAIIVSGGIMVKENPDNLPFLFLKKPLGDDFFRALQSIDKKRSVAGDS